MAALTNVDALQTHTRCAEKGCPFPPRDGKPYCAQHSIDFDEAYTQADSIFAEEILRTQNHGRRNGHDLGNREAVAESFGKDDHGEKSANLTMVAKPGLQEWIEKQEKRATHHLYIAQHTRLRQARLFAAGMCVLCGKLNDRLPITTCSACYGKRRQEREQRKRLGLCTHCGEKPSITGHTYCVDCWSEQVAWNERYKAERAARCAKRKRAPKTRSGYYVSSAITAKKRRGSLKVAGLCTVCGKSKDNPTNLCDPCRKNKNDYAARRRSERIAAGRCLQCGNPKERSDVRLCESCAVDAARRARRGYKKMRKTREWAGVCTSCGGPRDREGRTCSVCRARAADTKRRLKLKAKSSRCLKVTR